MGYCVRLVSGPIRFIGSRDRRLLYVFSFREVKRSPNLRTGRAPDSGHRKSRDARRSVRNFFRRARLAVGRGHVGQGNFQI